MSRRTQFPALTTLVALLLGWSTGVSGHGTASGEPGEPTGRAISFPDTSDFLTLVVDLHTHSVFSDGHVWPRIRVGEALRDGLDAVAITEHLEWQPHLADIPHPDRNRAYADAAAASGDADILIIAGSEITRNAPAGHMNAVFIEDANKLMHPPASDFDPADTVDYYTQAGQWPAQEAVMAANDQGAFVFWNHPFFSRETPDGIARMNTFHRDNAASGLLHGIEIANGQTYSEEAFDIALEHNLVLIGVSDVHNLIDWDYQPHTGGHRPVTLVFAEARTQQALRDALFAGRTVVWYRNTLLGRAEHLSPLLHASMTIEGARYRRGSDIVAVTVHNNSDARFDLANLSRYTFMESTDIVRVQPHGSTEILVKPGSNAQSISLEFEVLNALTAPGRHPSIRWDVVITPDENVQ